VERSNGSTGRSRPLVIAVDDDPEILRALERALRREPFEFVTTGNPGDVLRWICERRVDLVIADQRMPEMDGTDLLEVVRDYSPETACMILSGFPDTALIVEQAGLRIERLIAKPWDNDDLVAAIRRVLGERAPGPAETPAKTEVEVPCAGRGAREVTAEILLVSSRALDRGDKVTIVLKDLRALEDSLSRLLKGLARAVAWSHLPIDLSDDSGSVAAFLSALGRVAARK
jgi:DNA-binding response OmpR family regulator